MWASSYLSSACFYCMLLTLLWHYVSVYTQLRSLIYIWRTKEQDRLVCCFEWQNMESDRCLKFWVEKFLTSIKYEFHTRHAKLKKMINFKGNSIVWLSLNKCLGYLWRSKLAQTPYNLSIELLVISYSCLSFDVPYIVKYLNTQNLFWQKI